MARQLDDWIEAFVSYAKPYNTSSLFKEWLGVWSLGTAVGRALGSKIGAQQVIPNLFVLLIAGPGAGKSQAIIAARQVFLPATGYSLIPASITRAGLQDYMQTNLKTRRAPDGTTVPSNECIALSEEMHGILPEHDISHLTLYNELYSPLPVYRAQTRSHGEINLQLPYCSIVTGAQPAFLHLQLPEEAWGMGFMSRSIMVFDVQRERKDAFEFDDVDHALKSKVINDLKIVHNLYGWFTWEKGAKELYRAWWVEKGGPPIPGNKRLAMGYNARRDLHFFKLAMIFALSRGETSLTNLVVTIADAARAIEFLTRTESRMRHIFAEMSNTGAIAAYGDVIDAIKTRAEQGMPEADLIHMLMERYPPTQVSALIENLISSDVIREKPGSITGKGLRRFVPGGKMSEV